MMLGRRIPVWARRLEERCFHSVGGLPSVTVVRKVSFPAAIRWAEPSTGLTKGSQMVMDREKFIGHGLNLELLIQKPKFS